MPIHNWTRTDSGSYHDFHQDWTIEIRRELNRGLLPPGYMALADLKFGGTEPDFAAIQLRQPPSQGGLAVAEAPPRAQQVMRAETDDDTYARKANRIVIKHKRGQLVAIIEVVSPGNKNGIASFVGKMVDYLRNGINVVVIDLFPPGPRDPLPDAPLFLAPGWYVNIPLDRTYAASWEETPPDIRHEVVPEQPPQP